MTVKWEKCILSQFDEWNEIRNENYDTVKKIAK